MSTYEYNSRPGMSGFGISVLILVAVVAAIGCAIVAYNTATAEDEPLVLPDFDRIGLVSEIETTADAAAAAINDVAAAGEELERMAAGLMAGIRDGAREQLEVRALAGE